MPRALSTALGGGVMVIMLLLLTAGLAANVILGPLGFGLIN